ncbi:MAG: hypothetical protein AAF639_07285 [Chloroflexota bacterium]
MIVSDIQDKKLNRFYESLGSGALLETNIDGFVYGGTANGKRAKLVLMLRDTPRTIIHVKPEFLRELSAALSDIADLIEESDEYNHNGRTLASSNSPIQPVLYSTNGKNPQSDEADITEAEPDYVDIDFMANWPKLTEEELKLFEGLDAGFDSPRIEQQETAKPLGVWEQMMKEIKEEYPEFAERTPEERHKDFERLSAKVAAGLPDTLDEFIEARRGAIHAPA